MKRFAPYDWPYYASPSSNLSAFAAPFSVHQSSNDFVVSAPFIDPSESADSSVVPPIQFIDPPYCGYDFFSSDPVVESDSTPSSKPYGYSGATSSSQLPRFNTMGLSSFDSFSYDQCLNTSKANAVEAQPFYPNFVPPQIHDPSPSVAPTNHWLSSSGFATLEGSSAGGYANKSPDLGFTGQRGSMWSQFGELNRGKSIQVGVGSGFSSNPTNFSGSTVERMEQGCQDVQDSINGEASHTIGWEKHNVPRSADQLNSKPCWWGPIKPMPTEFQNTPVVAPSSVSIETHGKDPFKVSDPGHLSNISRQQCKPLRVDTVSSTPITTDLNIGSITLDGDLEDSSFLDDLHMHEERNEPSSSNNAMASDKNVPCDVVDYFSKEVHGSQDSHANLDSLSLRLCSIGNVNSVEKSFDGADQCSTAVDSPCWKGYPAGHCSNHQFSEALPPEYLHKNEKCFGSAIQEPHSVLVDTDHNVKKSCENSNNYQMQNENFHQETNPAGSTMISVPEFASENCNFDGEVNTGPLQSEPACDSGLKCPNGITEIKENNVSSIKPYDCESGSSHSEHHVGVNPLQSEPASNSGLKCLNDITEIKENNVSSIKPHDCESGSSHSEHHVGVNKLMLQKPHTSLADSAGAGSNVTNGLECSKSHMAARSVSSTVSVEDGPTTLEKSAENVSTPKFDVQTLVDRMNNLVEMLLMQLSNDACELKEQDCNALKNVISNLNTCVSKNAEQITPLQEPQPGTCSSAGESCKLQQNATFENQQVSQVEPESLKVEHENSLVQDAENLRFISERLVKKLSDSISLSTDAEMKHQENMIKDLKSILSENFHDDEGAEYQAVMYKNLWLEAEAELCSINYKARYYKMKFEMEKCKHNGMEEQSSLSKSQSSAIKVHADPNSDDSSVLDSSLLNSTSLTCLPDLKTYFDTNQPNAFPSGRKSSQDLDSLFQKSTVSESDMKKAAGDEEASVMARFRVLIARGEKSCMSTVNVEEKLSDTAANSPLSETEGQNQVNICHDSPTPCVSKDNDHEESVLARFHDLKSRVEDSGSTSSEYKLSDVFARKEPEKKFVTTKEWVTEIFDTNANSSMMYFSSHSAMDKSILEELHTDLEDHKEIEPCETDQFEDEFGSYYSDTLSSDWEHVEKKTDYEGR